MKADRVVDLQFGRELLSVTHPDGTHLHFTRQERTLLLRLINNPGRLLRRDVLISAINADGGEPAGDRHVDFLVTQLRRKLRDSARAPRFIRTQYGEGYVWIGHVPPSGEANVCLLRLGPVYGEHLPGVADLLEQLRTAIAQRLEPGRMADRSANGGGGKAIFTLEASLHDSGQALQAALVLRDGATSAILDTFRLATATRSPDTAIASTAEAVAHSIWASAALPSPAARRAPSEAPPWVRLFDAALMMNGDQLTWRANSARLEAILASEPDNAVMEVMHGLNLYTRLIQSLFDPSGQTIGEVEWRSIEDEMETIALANLARFPDDPVMQLAAVKLLLFVNRGYLHLSRRIAEDLLASSSAHAAAFAIAGEAAGIAGDIERCAELLERALELSETGSQFQVYLLVLEATSILASNDRPALERICRLTRDVSEGGYATLQAFCALPGFESAPLFTHIIARDAERAKESVRFLWNVSGRRYVMRHHRRNVMRPMTTALVARFGLEIIPDEVDLGTGLRSELSRLAEERPVS